MAQQLTANRSKPKAHRSKMGSAPSDAVEITGLALHPRWKTAVVGDDEEVGLTFTEARLLRTLLQAHPNPVSRNELFMNTWGAEDYVEDNTLNVNICRLRDKLSGRSVPVLIRVIRGYGYQLLVGKDAW